VTAPPRVIPPVPDRDDQYFWTGVEEGMLLARRCARCSFLQHPPSPMCPKCGSTDWLIQELSGRGVVYSWIVSRHPSEPERSPRIVALVELEEGPRLVSNLQDVAAAQVVTGMPVELAFAEIDGVRLPQFRPAGGRS
jgi:3-oxo-4,17-pregnadiene-20-carboxyl-CoA hydratase alpha subunit